MSSTTAATTAAARATEKPTDETIKETFESIVIAFILAFVFRAYVVEAFVIPTGSMAPTLLGEHVDIRCPQCGYHFTVQMPKGVVRPPSWGDPAAVCPMCHFPVKVPSAARVSAGDRILVQKYLYSVSEPRRWDVVVFKDPHDPTVNFIKRLVGLPTESVEIIDGNVYVATPVGDWHIARKTDRPEVQRAVWQPIYHSEFVPLDGGHSADRGNDHPWSVPWLPTGPAATDWATGGRSYRFGGQGEGEIEFDFSKALAGTVAHEPWSERARALYAYNQLDSSPDDTQAVEDVRVAATFQPDGAGLGVQLRTSARLDNPAPDADSEELTGRIEADGHAVLEAIEPATHHTRLLREGQAGAFAPGQARTVELWYVDQEASLWVDGRRILVWQYDLPKSVIENRRPPDSNPAVSIAVSGSPVTLHGVELDRDLYYGSYQVLGDGRMGNRALGGFVKYGTGQHEGGPVNLETDEFFCMGDNSPVSQDSRFWDTINPWIRARMLMDHHQQFGMVPRKLMMGRAFFVYFPAPYAWSQTGGAVFPNFGDMRFIH